MMPVVSDAGTDENGNYTIIGFKMLDDSGTELSRVMLPSGYESIENKVKVIDFGTKRYMLIYGDKIGFDYFENEDDKVFVYSIDTQASGAMQLVAELSGVAVNPRVARRSEPINVTFNTDGIASRKVIVTSVNGTVVMSKNVAQGETSVSIDTSRLSHGMYVVSVIENGKKSEHCKVVIR
ncbi:MAG: T9SS type A sorting domain-containing protein [Muribaculaceae bacterium]|nr:T9SS type A sorting domain-containing protein [Muribaculaceae bacterium]